MTESIKNSFRSFTPTFDPSTLLKQTNDIWNVFQFNAVRNVGKVSQLAKDKSFTSYQDWRNYYLESGKERQRLIATRPPSVQVTLQKTFLSAEEFYALSVEDKDLCSSYGRTKEEIREKAKLLQSLTCWIHPKLLELPDSTWEQVIMYRLLAETWNGCIVGEVNMRDWLEEAYPMLEWKLSSASMDTTYAVDVEGYLNKERLIGIQVKPLSYLENTQTYMLQQQRKQNDGKMKNYEKKFHVPAFYLYHEQGIPQTEHDTANAVHVYLQAHLPKE